MFKEDCINLLIIISNLSELEENEIDSVYKTYIEPFINEHVSFVFEEVCIQYLRYKNNENALAFKFTKIGRWWDKNNEIDIMAFDNENRYILGECKWRNKKIGLDVLDKLKAKSSLLKISNPIFYLFSKSGFTTELEKYTDEMQNIRLVDLHEIESLFI